jgi:enoyl-CoA hydratase/carnithine racemase
MTCTTLRYGVQQERILTPTLDHPEHLNAFTVEMPHELVHALHRASEDDNVGAIVVTGAGRAFREKRPPEFSDKASSDMAAFYPW